MLKIYNNPPRREWPALTARCTRQEGEITERVAAILSQVRTGGDKALRDLVARIEGYVPERFEVSRRQRTEAAKAVPQRLKTALAIAKSNIEAFHRAQLPPHRSAAKSTSGAIFPPRPAGVQSTTSPHPAIRAGRASISTVEKSGALPPGM